MKQYPYKKVDAFTSGNSLGNPAAYLYLNDDVLSDNEMLKISKEHKGFVSEVVFCTKSNQADLKLTYYSSECEVAFCGHGTIATMYEIIRNDEHLLNKPEIIIETNKKGFLTLYNMIKMENAIYITAPKAIWYDVPVKKDALAIALNINQAMISQKYPVAFIDAGLRTLIVPIEDIEKEISIYPESKSLKKFCEQNEIDIILIFSKETRDVACLAHTRVFAPKFGYLEDPATGSGNSAFGNYMIKYDMWINQTARIEQGGDNIVFNEIKLMKKNNDVLFGGKATTRIEGIYFLE